MLPLFSGSAQPPVQLADRQPDSETQRLMYGLRANNNNDDDDDRRSNQGESRHEQRHVYRPLNTRHSKRAKRSARESRFDSMAHKQPSSSWTIQCRALSLFLAVVWIMGIVFVFSTADSHVFETTQRALLRMVSLLSTDSPLEIHQAAMANASDALHFQQVRLARDSSDAWCHLHGAAVAPAPADEQSTSTSDVTSSPSNPAAGSGGAQSTAAAPNTLHAPFHADLPKARPVVTIPMTALSSKTCQTYFSTLGKFRHAPPSVQGPHYELMNRRELIVVLVPAQTEFTMDVVWNIRALIFEASHYAGRHLVLAVLGSTLPPTMPLDFAPWTMTIAKSDMHAAYPGYRHHSWPTDLVVMLVDDRFGRMHDSMWAVELSVRVTGSWHDFFESVDRLAGVSSIDQMVRHDKSGKAEDHQPPSRRAIDEHDRNLRVHEHHSGSDRHRRHIEFVQMDQGEADAATSAGASRADLVVFRTVNASPSSSASSHSPRDEPLAARAPRDAADQTPTDPFERAPHVGPRQAPSHQGSTCHAHRMFGYSSRGIMVLSRRLVDTYHQLLPTLHHSHAERSLLLYIAVANQYRAVEMVLPQGSLFGSGGSSSSNGGERQTCDDAMDASVPECKTTALSGADQAYAEWGGSWACRPPTVMFPVDHTQWSETTRITR